MYIYLSVIFTDNIYYYRNGSFDCSQRDCFPIINNYCTRSEIKRTCNIG